MPRRAVYRRATGRLSWRQDGARAREARTREDVGGERKEDGARGGVRKGGEPQAPADQAVAPQQVEGDLPHGSRVFLRGWKGWRQSTARQRPAARGGVIASRLSPPPFPSRVHARRAAPRRACSPASFRVKTLRPKPKPTASTAPRNTRYSAIPLTYDPAKYDQSDSPCVAISGRCRRSLSPASDAAFTASGACSSHITNSGPSSEAKSMRSAPWAGEARGRER